MGALEILLLALTLIFLILVVIRGDRIQNGRRDVAEKRRIHSRKPQKHE